MNLRHLILLLIAAFSGFVVHADAKEKAPPELVPDSFHFLRAEQHATETFGVFQFRYSHSKPLKFWGLRAPKDGSLTMWYTNYYIKDQSGWHRVHVGYCATSATTHVLQPGVDYELRIWLPQRPLSAAQQLRVSVDSPEGRFWSEPFNYPKQ